MDRVTFPAEYSVGPIRIAPATVLAPMAGVTDTVFRRLIRAQGGCGLIMTEFTSSHGVVAQAQRHRDAGSKQLLTKARHPRPEDGSAARYRRSRA